MTPVDPINRDEDFHLVQTCLEAMQDEHGYWTIRHLTADYISVTDERRPYDEARTIAHFSHESAAHNFVQHHAVAACLNKFILLRGEALGLVPVGAPDALPAIEDASMPYEPITPDLFLDIVDGANVDERVDALIDGINSRLKQIVIQADPLGFVVAFGEELYHAAEDIGNAISAGELPEGVEPRDAEDEPESDDPDECDDLDTDALDAEDADDNAPADDASDRYRAPDPSPALPPTLPPAPTQMPAPPPAATKAPTKPR